MIAEKILMTESLNDAACITWVRNVEPAQALTVFGGRKPFPMRTIAELDLAVSRELGGDYMKEIYGVSAFAPSDCWTILIEPNGFIGTVARKLLDLSEGTEAISVFWNVNALAEIAIARDSKALAVINDVVMFLPFNDEKPSCGIKDIYGSDPSIVYDLVSRLAKMDGDCWRSIAFDWISKFAGVGFRPSSLDEAHLTTIINETQQGGRTQPSVAKAPSGG